MRFCAFLCVFACVLFFVGVIGGGDGVGWCHCCFFYGIYLFICLFIYLFIYLFLCLDLCQWESEVSLKILNFRDTRQIFLVHACYGHV